MSTVVNADCKFRMRKAFKQIGQLDELACGRQGRHWTILFVQSVLDIEQRVF